MRRVVHLGLHRDRADRPPEALLEAWPTLLRGAAAVARTGWHTTLVLPAGHDTVLRRDGVTVRFVREATGRRRGPPGLRPVRASAPRLSAAVAEAAPDVVHIHGLALPGHAARLRRALGADVRIVAQDHADRPPRPWRRGSWRRAAASWDAVAFTHPDLAEPFRAAGALPEGLVVHPVLEASTEFTPGDPEVARRDAGVHGDPCLAWVGRLDANKDPLTALEGLARAVAALPDPQLWCCWTEAPLLPEVRRRVRHDPRLSGRIHLLGGLSPPEVQRLLRGADGLVLCSRREAMGFAVVEAMACGALPLVPDIPAFRRLTGGLTGRYAPGDPEALAATLRAWWTDPGRPDRQAVRGHFDTHLSWPAVGRELDAAYRACLAAPRPSVAMGRPS